MRDLARWRHLRIVDCADQGSEQRRPLGNVPRRQRHAATGDQHTHQLVRGALRLADMLDDDVADRGVE